MHCAMFTTCYICLAIVATGRILAIVFPRGCSIACVRLVSTFLPIKELYIDNGDEEKLTQPTLPLWK